jgi:CRP-like cAMP-binding protein
MYMLSRGRPSLGIEPRTPRMFGWSLGLQMLIVAHSWRDCSTELAARAFKAPEEDVARAERGSRSTASAAAGAGSLLAQAEKGIKTKIAPHPLAAWRFGAVWYSVSMAPTRSSEVVELLARVPVFATLEHSDLERIAQLAVPRQFELGQAVFREGDQSDTCYVVREGHARAIRSHGDGRTITLATFGPGDIFGELAMFEDERRSATVEAIEPISVVAVLGPDMRRLMIEHPEISTRLVIALGRRLREMNERLSRQSFQTVQSRVAVVLSELVAQELAEGADGGDVLVTATQADLAQLAGSSRESASRFLAVLERAGVISQGRGRLVVHEPEALKKYVF